ncbi:unnamed protein product, partial [Rotaria magnacalcarata]
SCQVNNGGCDSNAGCSHDASTNVVVCSCKNGYVNSGTDSLIKCTGMNLKGHHIRMLEDVFGLLDACQVNNGGCDSNATCSHDASTNGVVCSCKNGFVNTGCGTTVKCTGTISNLVCFT